MPAPPEPTPSENDKKVRIRTLYGGKDVQAALAIERANKPGVFQPEKKFEFGYTAEYKTHERVVVEYNKQIVGFMIYEKKRDAIKILNFEVHPDLKIKIPEDLKITEALKEEWERSTEKQMIGNLFSKFSDRRKTAIDFIIDETDNYIGIVLTLAGFRPAGMTQHAENTHADVWMRYQLSNAPNLTAEWAREVRNRNATRPKGPGPG